MSAPENTVVVIEATILIEDNGGSMQTPFIGRVIHRDGDWAGQDGYSIRCALDERVIVHRWAPVGRGRSIPLIEEAA